LSQNDTASVGKAVRVVEAFRQKRQFVVALNSWGKKLVSPRIQGDHE